MKTDHSERSHVSDRHAFSELVDQIFEHKQTGNHLQVLPDWMASRPPVILSRL
jgi:hypothetical protein